MGYFDDHEDRLIYGRPRRTAIDDEPRQPRCRRCGSEDVRWRQQGGRWVLFSTQPGVVHQCDVTDDFEDVSGGDDA